MTPYQHSFVMTDFICTKWTENRSFQSILQFILACIDWIPGKSSHSVMATAAAPLRATGNISAYDSQCCVHIRLFSSTFDPIRLDDAVVFEHIHSLRMFPVAFVIWLQVTAEWQKRQKTNERRMTPSMCLLFLEFSLFLSGCVYALEFTSKTKV